MYIRTRQAVAIKGLGRLVPGQIIALTGAEALPLIAAGQAVPDPYLDALKDRARKLGQNVDWADQPKFQSLQQRGVLAVVDEQSFGDKLKDAVAARLHPRAGVIAAPSCRPPSEESFAVKITRAVKARVAACSKRSR